ncbi:MAG: PilT/PilU family type 4a pilus ATPase [Myxococcota bacterium]
MPVIDGLLRLIEAQKAEGLVLNTHKPPALLHGGSPRLLSMPPMTPAMIETVVYEVLRDEQRRILTEQGLVETSYDGERGGSFSARVRVSTDKLVLTFRPLAHKAPRKNAEPSKEEEASPAAPVLVPPAALVPESDAEPSKPPARSVTATAKALLGRESARELTSRESAPRESTGRDNTARESTGRDNTGRDNTGRDNTGRDNTAREALPREQAGRENASRASVTREPVVRESSVREAPARVMVRGAARTGVEESLKAADVSTREGLGGAVAPGIMRLLLVTLERRCSDLLLQTGELPVARMGGDWQVVGSDPVDEPTLGEWLDPYLLPRHRELLAQRGSVDLAWQFEDNGRRRRLRVNLFRQLGGWSVAIRPVWEEMPSLSQLHLPDALTRLVDHPHGLVLITGATGAGKSTTLMSLVEQLNRTRICHILTLEDPIEYVFTRRKAIIHQREVGTHVPSFATGIVAALREAPDIIVVGELREREAIAAAITAAETGHLVLGTLHAGGAPMAIDRLIDVFPEHQQAQIRAQLAGVLRSVVTQRLLPGVKAGARFPALEILHVNHAVASLIRDRKVYQLPSQMQIGREDGMLTLEHSLVELVRTGRISRETATRATGDLNQLREWLREKS